MSIEAATLSVPAAALLGLAFGAGPCGVTCLPYLGPVFLSDGVRRWRTVGVFSAGRLTGYALLGTAAGALGQGLEARLESGWAAGVLGAATMLVGLLLMVRGDRQACNAPAPVAAGEDVEPVRFHRRPRRGFELGLFGMGFGMALNPCAPLGMVLLAAAATASAGAGLALGAAFGAGAVILPAIAFGALVARFGAAIRGGVTRWGAWLNRAAGGALIGLGAVTLSGGVIL